MAHLSHFAEVIAGTTKPIIDVDDAAQTLKVTRNLEDLLLQQVK